MVERTLRLLLESEGFLKEILSYYDDTRYWMAEQLNGHPRAQDFEPTGHGGSDPTSVNGIKDDSAFADGKNLGKDAERVWKSLDAMVAVSRRYRTAKRPERKSEDLQDVWCVVHWQLGYPEPRAHLDLCDPCYRYKSNHNGEYPTVADVEYYIAHHGRWPSKRVDPKNPPAPVVPVRTKRKYIAGLENLQEGAATLGKAANE